MERESTFAARSVRTPRGWPGKCARGPRHGPDHGAEPHPRCSGSIEVGPKSARPGPWYSAGADCGHQHMDCRVVELRRGDHGQVLCVGPRVLIRDGSLAREVWHFSCLSRLSWPLAGGEVHTPGAVHSSAVTMRRGLPRAGTLRLLALASS